MKENSGFGCLSRNGFSRSSKVFFVAILLLSCLSSLPVEITFASNEKMRDRAQKALREGEFEKAEKIYREILTKDSLDIQARIGLSFALLKKRNLREAYDNAARAIALDPLSSRAHAILGTVILTSGDFRRSIEEFKTALSLKSDDAMAVAGMAMVDYYENRLNECVNGLRRASFIDPNEPDYVFALGQAAARFERYKDAADAYEKFLRIAPKTDTDRRDRIRGLIDFLRYLGDQSSLYEPGGDDQTSIKFDMVDDRPNILIKINDRKEPLRFVLDTGSGMSVISEETANRLGLKSVARGGVARAIGADGKFEIVYGFLKSMQIGNVKIGQVPVYIRKFYSVGKPADGYLGISAISSFITTVDYKQKTLSLIRRRDADTIQQALLNPTNQNESTQNWQSLAIPTRMTSSGFVTGEVKLEGFEESFNFILDTGASISILSNQIAQKEELIPYLMQEKVKLYGAAGVSEDNKQYKIPKITFGPHEQKSVRMVGLDLNTINETTGFEQTGILGTNFLAHYRITFDFGGGLVILEPNNRTNNSVNQTQTGAIKAIP